MKVRELAGYLAKLPPDAEVRIIYDGAARMGVDYLWLAKGGAVMLTGEGEVVYEDACRPSSAPAKEQDRFWTTPDWLSDDDYEPWEKTDPGGSKLLT